MDTLPWNQILFAINSLIKWYDRRKPVKKTSFKDFMKDLEKKVHTSLSIEDKQRVKDFLYGEGRLVRNRLRNYVVISKPIQDVARNVNIE